MITFEHIHYSLLLVLSLYDHFEFQSCLDGVAGRPRARAVLQAWLFGGIWSNLLFVCTVC